MSFKDEPRWPHSPSEKLVFGFLFAISYLILSLPRSWQMKLGDKMGDLFFHLAGYRQNVVRDNLKIAFPQQTADEREAMTRAHFRHLGNVILEYLWSPALTKKYVEKWCVIEGREHFDNAVAGGKGGLIFGSHMGSGDMGIIASTVLGYPMVLVGKTTRTRWVTRMLFGLREIHGVRALPESGVTTEIFRCFRRNEIVIFVIDQFMGPPMGSETQFFGHDTGTVTSVAVFSERMNMPVIPVWTYRDARGVIHIEVEPPIKLENMTPVQMTQFYNDKLESFARQYPEQWFWVHQRWKKFIRH
jgi:KDO2-lipid IV(A) lauroyltransferase